MFDVANVVRVALEGLAGGITITLAYWSYVTLAAWRHFRDTPNAAPNAFTHLLWSARLLVENTNYLRLLMFATSVCMLVSALAHNAR